MNVKHTSIRLCDLTQLQSMERRAVEEYFHSGGVLQPNLEMTGIYEVEDTTKGRFNCNGEHPIHFYVRLANAVGTLAVFRELHNGKLKRLKRWPRSVETGEASPLADFYTALSEVRTDPGLLAEHPDLTLIASELAAAI